jgi:hypothetical protein
MYARSFGCCWLGVESPEPTPDSQVPGPKEVVGLSVCPSDHPLRPEVRSMRFDGPTGDSGVPRRTSESDRLICGRTRWWQVQDSGELRCLAINLKGLPTSTDRLWLSPVDSPVNAVRARDLDSAPT